MAFLSLKNIGKIYVSEGNVAVGIRGVNLDFEKGEFVIVTGESGSGKSTLLNVISGMDGYEEGELLIDGEPTSHYSELDRETYREKYISFIFQDYNILESFTVLQNVELALMSIEDKRERRARAVELLKRVGLGDRLHQKGSKLSGGQKQRTVIARALAKDSPIILADEPTGNLDSSSAKEIVELLREVSRDKLLIMVTHNPEEAQGFADREVRVFDGAVASDRRLKAENGSFGKDTDGKVSSAREDEKNRKQKSRKNSQSKNRHRALKDGLTLGRALFTATPKLSLFLCLLLVIGALGMFTVTALCGEIPSLLKKTTMFTDVDGRLVVARSDGEALSEEELKTLAQKTGAQDVLHYDYLLDADRLESPACSYVEGAEDFSLALYPEILGESVNDAGLVGRLPQAEDECLLELCISHQASFGTDGLSGKNLSWCGLNLTITGVRYFYDNTQKDRIVLTRRGFENASAAYLACYGEKTIYAGFTSDQGLSDMSEFDTLVLSCDIPEGEAYVQDAEFLMRLSGRRTGAFVQLQLQDCTNAERSYELLFDAEDVLKELPEGITLTGETDNYLLIHPDTLRKAVEKVLTGSYRQGSLFFADDKAAAEAAQLLREEGYIAVTADSTYTPPLYETIGNTFLALVLIALWVLMTVFLAFFIHLCSGKAVGAFKHDLAILRSMGIPAQTVCLGLFGRLYLSLLPALAAVAATALVVFRSPKLNSLFTYLYAWEYALLVLGLVIITFRVGLKQVKKLFGETVRTALRGGDNA